VRSRARVALGTAAVLALLAGCRTAPAPAPAVPGPGAGAPWAEQYAALAGLQDYALAGRVAVAANGQGFSANLRYRQQQQRSELALDGPMGIGGMRLQFDERELSVTNSRGEKLDGAAARAEVENRLGFELPLAELRWWLLGLPDPGAPAEQHPAGTDDAITDFLQNGWRVSIDSRAPGLGFSLPRRLTAERAGARLKLLVESWQP
jgi:outer membrane lipoprotein LolB